MAVGRVYDGAVAAAVASDSSVGTENFVIRSRASATTAG
jgi:hypothetical protein